MSSPFTSHRHVALRLILLLSVCLGLCSGVAASTIELSYGVLLDDDNGTLLVTDQKRGLVALRLKDGGVVWRRSEVLLPIAIANDQILVHKGSRRPGQLRLLSLQLDDGSTIADEIAQLPANVLAGESHAASSPFRIGLHPRFPASRLVWHYRAPRAGQGKIRPLILSGVVNVSIETARAGVLDEPSPEMTPRSARVPTPFAGGPAFFSADRKHVLVSQKKIDGQGFIWTLHDLDARQLGDFSLDVPYAPFVVRGDLVVILNATSLRSKTTIAPGRTLRAVDWRRGEIVWEW